MAVKSGLRRIIRLECLGFTLILICFFIFDFYPSLRAASLLRERIMLARKAFKTISQSEIERQKNEFEKELDRNKENLQFLRQVVSEFQDKIVQEKNILLITKEIVSIVASSQIVLGSIRPLSSQVKGEYELLPIEIRFQCGYTDLIDFLSKVEASSTLVAVQGLSINRDEALLPKLDICVTAGALLTSEEKDK